MIRGASIIGGCLRAGDAGHGPDYFTKFLQPVFGGSEAAGPEGRRAPWNSPWRVSRDYRADRSHGSLLAFLKRPGKADSLAKSLRGIYTTLLNKYYVTNSTQR